MNFCIRRRLLQKRNTGGHHILMYSPHPEMGNVGYAKRKDTINFLLLYNGLFYLSSL